ncbi:hypothetical protein D3C81_1421370 [compost metagenome]
MGARTVAERQQPDQRQRQQHPGFHHQPRQRGDRRLLADQPIETEGQRQQQRYPGQVAQLPDLLGHADRRQAHGHPLQRQQALAQHQHAEQHVDQRVDVVAETGFKHPPVVHRPYVDQPVAGDQHSAGAQHGEALRVFPQFAPPAGVLPDQQQERAEERRPDGPVGDDLQRRNAFEQFEVERKESPDHVGSETEGITPAGIGGGHGTSLVRRLMIVRPF